MLLKDFARALAEAGLHPVLAHPVGPLEPPRLEVDRWQKNALHQLGFGGDGLGEEGGVEHLECRAGAGDTRAVEFSDFPHGTAGGDYAEGLSQVVGDKGKGHLENSITAGSFLTPLTGDT